MARATKQGKGWHSQSVRHSNAKRFGKAGGKYVTPQYLNAPLSKRATQLPIQFKIIVPSTKNKNEPLTKAEYDERVKDTAKQLSEKFGGDTTIQGIGGYISQDGEHITENIAVIESSMKLEDYNKNKRMLGNFIKRKQKKWGQESIGYQVEGELYVYPKFDEK